MTDKIDINRIDINNIKLAKVRYFDEKNEGVEISKIEAYVLLININGEYVNFFDHDLRSLPIFKRAHCSNISHSGESFGTRLIYINGDLRSGPCYVIEDRDLSKYFERSVVSLNDLKKFIIFSNSFFVDRQPLILSCLNTLSRKERRIAKKKYLEDDETVTLLNKYFSDRMDGYQYLK